MKIQYDSEVDVLSIVFSENPIEITDEEKPGVFLDYDKDGNIVGLGILDASTRMGNSTLLEYNCHSMRKDDDERRFHGDPPLVMPDQFAGMRFGLQVTARSVLSGRWRTALNQVYAERDFTHRTGAPGIKYRVGKVNMKKNEKTNGKKIEKKVLAFPAPREPEITSMTFQIGRDRFIIHWEIENLPPVTAPPLLLKVPPKKGKLIR